MADNVTANSGSGGATFKTDEDTVASAHVPVTKIELGANSSFDGYVSTSNPMPCGGPAAENAAVSGNPILSGGRYDATPRTLGNGDVGAIALEKDGSARVVNIEPSGRFDTFGRMVTVTPNNDIDIQFFRAAPETLVNVTTANSATATQNTGGALFASSTNANGSVQGVTNQKTVYRSGSEIYCMFTASFTAGIANSFMRIGLYDANNGFFIGYEGTSFGVTYRNNTSDTTVAKGSFSVDTLTGATGSKFTRAGVPEAIDLTKLNVFRLRFGWLGSAPAVWEVMSPDGAWIKFHETLFPNLQAGPSIENSDLPVTIDITKTSAAATDLQIQTDCWGAGATITEKSGYVDTLNSRFASTLSAGTSWNASGSWVDVHRYSLAKILIYSSTTNASGTLQVEFSMDGSTVHRTINYTVNNASNHPPHVVIPIAQFMRVSYDADAGGGNNHADFTVQTIYSINANKLPTSKITSTIDDSTDVDNVRAILVGENPAAGGSYVNVKVDANGQLQTDIASDSVGLSTEATLGSVQTAVELIDDAVYIDDADWTAATSKHILTGGVYSATPRTVTDGDTAPFAMDVNGHMITSAHAGSVALNDNVSNTVNLMVDEADAFMACATFGFYFDGTTWDRMRGDATDGLLVNLGSNNDVTVTGTVTANLSATDNTVLDNIDTNTSGLAQAEGSALGNGILLQGDDGTDRKNINVDATTGDVQVDVTNTVTVDLGANNDIQGDIAHDSADSGNPLKIGAKAETSISGVTLVTDGDRTDLHAGVDGVLITRPYANLEDLVDGNASNTDGNSTSVIAAAGAGIKQYLLSATITNTSATDTYCEIKSGTTTKWTVPVPANGGVTLNWPSGLKPNAANEAWNFDMGAAVTTAYCSMSGFKSKV